MIMLQDSLFLQKDDHVIENDHFGIKSIAVQSIININPIVCFIAEFPPPLPPTPRPFNSDSAHLKGYALCRRLLFASPGLPFWGLSASIFAFWETISAPREYLGRPFWHLGTTWTRGGSSQDFIWFWGDFGSCVYQPSDFKKIEISLCFRACFQVIFLSISNIRTCVYQFFDFKKLSTSLFPGLFPGHFLSISESKFRRLRLPNRGVRKEGSCKSRLFTEIVLMSFSVDICCFFWKPQEPFFWFLGLENIFENE